MAEDNERLSDTNPAEKLRPGDPDPSAPRDAEADGSLAAPGRPTRRSPTWRTAPRGSAPRPAVCEAGGFVRWYRGLFSDLGAFTREQAVPLALSALVVAATYAHLLFTNNIGIDTETMVNVPGTILNWYGIGREGMVLSKFVLGTLDFNMYWAEYLGLAFLLLAVWMWCFLLHRLGARRRLTFCVFPMVFATHPIFVEQFYFTTQMAEFNFALLMVPVAFLLIVEGARSRSAGALGVAGTAGCLLFLWAFASYQSFLALVLATGALTGLMMARQDPFDRAAFKRCAWCFALAFIASAAAYLVITRTWFSSSDYLTGQILWGTQSVALCLRSLGRAVRDMAFGEGRFYTPVYIVAAVLLVCRLAVDFGRGAGAGRRGFIVLASALLLVCPFLLPAVMATAPAARTAFTLPFVSASALVLLWEGSDSTAPGLAVKRLAMAVLVLAVTGVADGHQPAPHLHRRRCPAAVARAGGRALPRPRRGARGVFYQGRGLCGLLGAGAQLGLPQGRVHRDHRVPLGRRLAASLPALVRDRLQLARVPGPHLRPPHRRPGHRGPEDRLHDGALHQGRRHL